MRKIEKQMIAAIRANKSFKHGNTEVEKCFGAMYVYLFGNLICYIKRDGTREYYTHGWNTATTRSRLNALGCNCRIKNGVIVYCDTLEPVRCN